jgi:hypothetical protein
LGAQCQQRREGAVRLGAGLAARRGGRDCTRLIAFLAAAVASIAITTVVAVMIVAAALSALSLLRAVAALTVAAAFMTPIAITIIALRTITRVVAVCCCGGVWRGFSICRLTRRRLGALMPLALAVTAVAAVMFVATFAALVGVAMVTAGTPHVFVLNFGGR